MQSFENFSDFFVLYVFRVPCRAKTIMELAAITDKFLARITNMKMGKIETK